MRWPEWKKIAYLGLESKQTRSYNSGKIYSNEIFEEISISKYSPESFLHTQGQNKDLFN